jgi:hypothetical protein
MKETTSMTENNEEHAEQAQDSDDGWEEFLAKQQVGKDADA